MLIITCRYAKKNSDFSSVFFGAVTLVGFPGVFAFLGWLDGVASYIAFDSWVYIPFWLPGGGKVGVLEISPLVHKSMLLRDGF